jgi:hypothetical protein
VPGVRFGAKDMDCMFGASTGEVHVKRAPGRLCEAESARGDWKDTDRLQHRASRPLYVLQALLKETCSRELWMRDWRALDVDKERWGGDKKVSRRDLMTYIFGGIWIIGLIV